jgi:hypothetical protein
MVGGGQAGGTTHGAIDVCEGTARPADDVVVVVPDSRFVACHRARWLYAPYETCGSKHTKHVVDRLMGYVTVILAYDTDD